jgi:plastocyanin
MRDMKRRTTLALALAVSALVLATTACGGDDNEPSAGGTTTETTTEETTTSASGGQSSGTLEGETGPGFTIEVSQNGKDAEEVKAGTYTLKVEDKSDMHNFHLIGPGVDDVVTEVDFVGEKTVTVTLQPGTYTYQCDPHANAGMKGTFTVT